MHRKNYQTKSVTLRVPAVILTEINKRIDEDIKYGQTEVILDALCHAFNIPHPRPRKRRGTHDTQSQAA